VRIVVFTGNRSVEETPWWPVLLDTPNLERVLVVRQVAADDLAAVWRRFRGNVRKYGVIFVPYRLAFMVFATLRRLVGSPAHRGVPAPNLVPVDFIDAGNIHAPDVLARISDWKPDLGASLGAPILRPSAFRIPRRGTINLPLGKVPDFRGAPPAFWELWTGASTVGATVHWIDEGLDTGAVLGAAEAPVYATDNLEVLQQRAAEIGQRVLGEVLRALAAGDPPATAQPAGGRTFRFPTVEQRVQLDLRLLGRWLWRSTRPRRLVKTMLSLLSLYVVRPIRDAGRSLVGGHPVHVFTFHRLTGLCRDGMTVSAEVFRRQLDYTCRHHEMVSMDRALELLASGSKLRRPVAVLTFDDAYDSVIQVGLPFCTERDVVGCCFASTDLVGTDRRFPHDAENPVRAYLGVLGWGELRRLRETGWTVGGHGASHARLSNCRREELVREVAAPIEALRLCLGVERVPMAYPFGGIDDLSATGRTLIRANGYAACFSNFGGENFPGDDLFSLKRIDIGGDHDALAWKTRVHGIDLGRWRSWWESDP